MSEMSDDTTANGHDGEYDLEDGADAARIEALEAEVAALKEQVLRYAAEADNTKRRAEREANDARAYAIQKFAKDLFPAADYLSAATAHAPRDSADAPVKNFVIGVEMTEKELLAAFDRNGLKRVAPTPGEKFDPHVHQAMAEEPGEGLPPGSVVRTMQAGFTLFGRTLRPAVVVVAAKGAAAAPEPSDASAANPYAAEGDAAGGSVDTKA